MNDTLEQKAAKALRVLDAYLNDTNLDDELDRVSHLLRDAIEQHQGVIEAMRVVLIRVNEYRDYRGSAELDQVANILGDALKGPEARFEAECLTCICGHHIDAHSVRPEFGIAEPCTVCDCRDFISNHEAKCATE